MAQTGRLHQHGMAVRWHGNGIAKVQQRHSKGIACRLALRKAGLTVDQPRSAMARYVLPAFTPSGNVLLFCA